MDQSNKKQSTGGGGHNNQGGRKRSGPPQFGRTNNAGGEGGGSWRSSGSQDGPPRVAFNASTGRQMGGSAVQPPPKAMFRSGDQQPPRSGTTNQNPPSVIEPDNRVLLILDVNGVLLRRDDFEPGRKRSYVLRPYCHEFLEWVFTNFACGLWTCGKKETLEMEVFEKYKSHIVFTRTQDDSTNLWPRRSVVSLNKPLFLKELRTLWKEDPRWNENNTILIDNHAEKFERNPAGTCFLIPDFVDDNNDDVLKPGGPVMTHLSAMLKAESRAEYARANIDSIHFSYLKDPPSVESLAEYDQTVLRRQLAEMFTSSHVMRTLSPERDVQFYMNHKDIPGPRARPFRRRDIPKIAQSPLDWVVCEKTDGTRSLFFIPENRQMAESQNKIFGYFVDRSWNFELVIFDGNSPFGNMSSNGGVLLDGEYVSHTSPPVFLIFDVVFLNGEDVGAGLYLQRRMDQLKTFLAPSPAKQREDDASNTIPRVEANFRGQTCLFMIKPFHPVNHVNQLDINKANYPIIGQMNCDGLVFTPSKNVPYYQTMVVKFKPSERLTVDFLVQVTNDLQRSDVAQLKLGDNISAGELKLDKAAKQALGIGGGGGGGHNGNNNNRRQAYGVGNKKIVECEFDRASGFWRLVQVRHDKIKSNSPSTAWSVLESIAEHVQLQELVDVLSNLNLEYVTSVEPNARDHYDARQKHRDDNGDLDSRIRVLRNLNNFVKGSLIGTGGALDLQKLSDHVDPIPKLLSNPPSKPGKQFRNKQNNKSSATPVRVLDLACGRGGDLGKWFKSHTIDLYVGLDISPASLAEAERRAKDMVTNASEICLFLECDASKDDFFEMIVEKLKTARSGADATTMKFDFVSIQFALHYFCQSPEAFEVFLKRLKPLCTPNTKILVTKLDESVVRRKLDGKASWQNDVCKIEALEKDDFRTIINFSLGDAVVELPEPLVSLRAMEHVLNKTGFKITAKANTSSFLSGICGSEFGRALQDELLVAFGKNHNDRAISASEWEALQLYCLMTIELI